MANGDMFLKIEGAKQGPIKGEAQDKKHLDEIDIFSWSWGMQGQMQHANFGAASPKTTIQELKVIKRVDRSTTALMSCLRNNELIKKAVLTVRKAGGPEALEYFKITMEKARIASIETRSGRGEDSALLEEEISIAFNKVNVEYKPQGPDGQARGATMFEADISANA